MAQPFLVSVPEVNTDRYLSLWMGIAVSSLAVTLLEVALSYLRSDSHMERQLTRRALQQFLPSLIVGAILTMIISADLPTSLGLLPGLWSSCFGLGILASVPFVTPAVGWVGLYYIAMGAVGLMNGHGSQAFSPWFMGGTFGIGQLLMANVLRLAEVKRNAQA